MNTRRFFAFGLSVLLLANVAYAGSYQRTKDGKILVWNDQPKPGDAATWSGARDADGYATGYGTLTWFAANKVIETGTNIPSARRYTTIARYSGKMVHGKLQGQVADAEANRKTSRGKATKVTKGNGRTAAPTPGPTRTRKADHQPKKPAFRHGVEEAPPTQAQKIPASTPAPAVTATPVPVNDSLGSLANPPSSLGLTPAAEASPQASPSVSPSASPQ